MMNDEENIPKIDFSFLETDGWKEYKVGKNQLKEMFLKEYRDNKRDNPDIDNDELIEYAKEDLESVLQNMNKGGNAPGLGVNFGFKKPFDYTGRWSRMQIKAYNDLADGKVKSVELFGKSYNSIKELVDGKLIRIDKIDGKNVPVALDKRKTEESGYITYPKSSFMSSFLSYWKCSIDNKKYIVHPIVGGEFNDSQVNPRCPECGKVGWTNECNEILIKTKKGEDGKISKFKVKCNGIRENFIIPELMKNVGQLSTFSLKVKTNENSISDIEWSNKNTVVPKGKRLSLKYKIAKDEKGNVVRNKKGKAIKELAGDLMDWIPKSRIITTKKIKDIYKDDNCMIKKTAKSFWDKFGDEPVFHVGRIYQMGETSYYDNRTYYVADETTGKDDGLMLRVPEFVHKYNVKDVFGEKSTVLTAGFLQREPKKDIKTKKIKWESVKVDGKTQKIMVYNRPYINVTCIIPIRIKPPTKKMKLDLALDDMDIEIKVEPLPPSDGEEKQTKKPIKEDKEIKQKINLEDVFDEKESMVEEVIEESDDEDIWSDFE